MEMEQELGTRIIAEYEGVKHFSYLGPVLMNTGGCKEEVHKCLAMAIAITIKLIKTWKDTYITKNTKL